MKQMVNRFLMVGDSLRCPFMALQIDISDIILAGRVYVGNLCDRIGDRKSNAGSLAKAK
jgi:hypothetical protein